MKCKWRKTERADNINIHRRRFFGTRNFCDRSARLSGEISMRLKKRMTDTRREWLAQILVEDGTCSSLQHVRDVYIFTFLSWGEYDHSLNFHNRPPIYQSSQFVFLLVPIVNEEFPKGTVRKFLSENSLSLLYSSLLKKTLIYFYVFIIWRLLLLERLHCHNFSCTICAARDWSFLLCQSLCNRLGVTLQLINGKCNLCTLKVTQWKTGGPAIIGTERSRLARTCNEQRSCS